MTTASVFIVKSRWKCPLNAKKEYENTQFTGRHLNLYLLMNLKTLAVIRHKLKYFLTDLGGKVNMHMRKGLHRKLTNL